MKSESNKLVQLLEERLMVRVLMESPYHSSDPAVFQLHVKYAVAGMRDCFSRGEAPFASHLLYAHSCTLNDGSDLERAWGIHAGLMWGALAETTVVYADLGISSGMKLGIDRAIEQQRPVEYRTILDIPEDGDLLARMKAVDRLYYRTSQAVPL